MARKPYQAHFVSNTGSTHEVDLRRMHPGSLRAVADAINNNVDPATGWSSINLTDLSKAAAKAKQWAGNTFGVWRRCKPPFIEMERERHGNQGWGPRVRVRATEAGVKAFASQGIHLYLAPAVAALGAMERVVAFGKEVSAIPGVKMTLGGQPDPEWLKQDAENVLEDRVAALERTMDALSKVILERPSLLEQLAEELEDVLTAPKTTTLCDHDEDLAELAELRAWRDQIVRTDPTLRKITQP